MAANRLVIRPIADGDFDLLKAQFDEGAPEQPEQGLARQRSGQGDFLIAFLDGRPVGYLALYWHAEPHSPASWSNGVANLSQFVVLTPYRSRGIGTRLIRVAERMAVERGFRYMSLGVGIDNKRARRLYERLGYADAGLDPVTDEGTFQRWDGTQHSWRETWRFMLKELPGGGPGS